MVEEVIFNCLPENEKAYDQLLLKARKYHLFERAGGIISNDKSIIRISGRSTDKGSNFYREINRKFEQYVSQHSQLLRFRLTGAAHLMDNANLAISRHLTRGILLAVFIAGGVILVFFRSLKLTVLSLIVNLVPLVFAAGIMGLFGIPLKVSTALVFTIIYGVAVDDTIHFLNNYQSYLSENNGAGAEKQTILKMTGPMVFTSLVLFAGFMIFSLSDFLGIRYIGLLTGFSLIVALVGDLILLPVLLEATKGKDIRKERRKAIFYLLSHLKR